MHSLKFIHRCKSTQVHALNSSDPNPKINLQTNLNEFNSFLITESILHSVFPETHILEPPIHHNLTPLNLIQTLADIYGRLETCAQYEKSSIYLEQFSVLHGTSDAKLLRRCLLLARQHAIDVHSKVVLSAWLWFERKDKLDGSSLMEVFECHEANLVSGYDPNSHFNNSKCCLIDSNVVNDETASEDYEFDHDDDDDVSFCVGDEEISCVRYRIGMLSSPLHAMLYGSFMESMNKKIDFSDIGVSAEGMRGVEFFSRTKKLDPFRPNIVLELLSFANRFCCEEMKSTCDAHLAAFVNKLEDALILIDYGLAETSSLLVASCLQVFLRHLPSSLYNQKVFDIFSTIESRERLAMVGHASFLLYLFLSHVANEENMASSTIIMLLERLSECAIEKWQKALASHRLGCLKLEGRDYKEAQICFEEAAEAGHVYSLVGAARTMYKQGHKYSAYKLMNRLISDYKPVGWMYQERSLYRVGKDKISDLDITTELDPTLLFPYKYRAISMMEEKNIESAIREIDKIIGFQVAPDCLELRALLFMAMEDYESALRDFRAILTFEPNYMMLNGKIRGDFLVERLGCFVQKRTQADCWMQLHDRWSSVDDIGSLAVIHEMLENEPGKSFLLFRQSLLLLRLNCQKTAIRSLQLAQNNSRSLHERLVYEGWILYDMGNREEALTKAEESISLQRSFEAFFLKAYLLVETRGEPESSSCAVKLLEEALRCPSDGLRKGQALNNLGSIYLECHKLDLAANCYINAIDIKHTRAHQGLARVYHLRNQREAAYDEMTKLINKAPNNAAAYEKRSEYCDREMVKNDLSMATQLDPLRTYPYRYRAAVLMDDQKETEAIEELTRAIAFKPELQMLHLRAAFHESMGEYGSALQDCEAALCLEPNHKETLEIYRRACDQATHLTT